MRPLRSKLPELYGNIVDGKWPAESRCMTVINVPMELHAAMGVTHIYCNEDMSIALSKALDNIVARELIDCVKSYGGCWDVRKSRSDDRLSVHSYGLAIDLNPETNKLGTVGDMDPRLVACFEDCDFEWGGRWKNPDPMHMNYVIED